MHLQTKQQQQSVSIQVTDTKLSEIMNNVFKEGICHEKFIYLSGERI